MASGALGSTGSPANRAGRHGTQCCYMNKWLTGTERMDQVQVVPVSHLEGYNSAASPASGPTGHAVGSKGLRHRTVPSAGGQRHGASPPAAARLLQHAVLLRRGDGRQGNRGRLMLLHKLQQLRIPRLESGALHVGHLGFQLQGAGGGRMLVTVAMPCSCASAR